MKREEILELVMDEEVCDKLWDGFEEMRLGYESTIEAMKKENELDLLLKESGVRSPRAVKALIDRKGDIAEQIKSLKEDCETSFLFETKKSFKPGKSSGKLPDTKKTDYLALLSDARKRGDGVEAIKIKKMAANEGIILI